MHCPGAWFPVADVKAVVYIGDVVAGCVVQASEQALNIGRSAVLAAGWPESIPATTVDRQCGSSQQAAHFAAHAVIAAAPRTSSWRAASR